MFLYHLQILKRVTVLRKFWTYAMNQYENNKDRNYYGRYHLKRKGIQNDNEYSAY